MRLCAVLDVGRKCQVQSGLQRINKWAGRGAATACDRCAGSDDGPARPQQQASPSMRITARRSVKSVGPATRAAATLTARSCPRGTLPTYGPGVRTARHRSGLLGRISGAVIRSVRRGLPLCGSPGSRFVCSPCSAKEGRRRTRPRGGTAPALPDAGPACAGSTPVGAHVWQSRVVVGRVHVFQAGINHGADFR